MKKNPKLRKRIKRIPKKMVGRNYQYFPAMVSANTTLKTGEYVTVVNEPYGQGDIKMVEVCRDAVCMDSNFVKLTKTGKYRRILIRVPVNDLKHTETFHIFVKDLAYF